MKIAVISDIHGNYEALKSVTKDIEKSKVGHIFCLGDLIGYGPEPEKIVGYFIQHNITCILGNHDQAIFDVTVLDSFNKNAHDSIILTKKLISEKSIDYLRKLPNKLIEQNILFIHGSPPDSIFEYISELADERLIGIFKELKQNIAFVGHTHDLKRYSFDGEKVIKKNLHRGIWQLNKDQKHIINVGSVGQPRDGNNNAKYVISNNQNFSIDVRLIPYKIKVTVNLIKELGFPKANASRLW